MVVSNFAAGFRASLAPIIALMVVSPAHANNNADVTAPLREAQTAKQSSQSTTDREFTRLFADWRSLERSPSPVTAPPALSTTGKSAFIPSRPPIEEARLTSAFGVREHPVLGGRRVHEGVDLAAPVGTPVYAPADGTVARADWFSSYGLYIQLEHQSTIETRYGHLSRLNVAAGQHVHKGDIIGFVGTTGRSTGPHLHYEVRVDGTPVNPVSYMGGDVIPTITTAQASTNDAKGG